MSLGTPKMPTAYRALLGEVTQRPGHHYIYHREMEYPEEKRMDLPATINTGFMARAFFYNEDNNGIADISIYYKTGAQSWYMEMKYESNQVTAIRQSSTKITRTTKETGIKIEDGSFYSMAVHCKDETNMDGYLNKDFIHTGSVSTIPGYVWALTLEVHSGQKLLSVHLTFENALPTLPISEYWGTKSYLSTNHWVPTGTIGVFECVLADPSKENSMSLLDESNKEKKAMKFSTSSLPVNSVLYYNIRLSPTAYIVSTSFDDTSETVYENARGGAHFIKANFSDAVYVRRYDMAIPFFVPP